MIAEEIGDLLLGLVGEGGKSANVGEEKSSLRDWKRLSNGVLASSNSWTIFGETNFANIDLTRRLSCSSNTTKCTSNVPCRINIVPPSG